MGYRLSATLAVASSVLATAGSARATSPADYFGGPVMHREQIVLVEWGTRVESTFTNPTTGDPAFVQYLESQRGTTTDIGGVVAQYGDVVNSVAGNAANAPSYGGEIVIAPAKGAGASVAKVNDADIQTQLENSVASGELPQPKDNGLGTIYAILFPPADTIVGPAGTDSVTGFCAYHNTAGTTASPLLYAVIPDTNAQEFAKGQGCGPETTALKNETSVLSHELAETITDPEVGFETQSAYASPAGWASNAANEGEIADICDTQTPSQDSTNGPWVVQTLWSNLDNACMATEPKYSAPTAVITPPSSVDAGTAAAFSADGSSDPASNTIQSNNGLVLSAPLGPGIASYAWDWGDGTTGSTGPDPHHAYAQAGKYTVVLTVTDTLGFTASTTAQVTVSNPATPAVTTTAATSVSDTGGSLNGTINPWGHSTTYQFVYGTSPSNLDQSTTTTDAGAGTASEPVSATLSGLAVGTTYYYDLVATYGNGGNLGTVDGGVQSFTTTGGTPPPSAPVPATVAASQIGSGGATLNGTINPEGLNSVTYSFAWGTSAGALTQSTSDTAVPSGTTAQPVSAPLSGLEPGVTYYYRLDVQYGGQTYSGQVLSFSTVAVAATVAAGSPTAVTASGATLQGTVDPNGFATSYAFQYGTTTSYGQSSAMVSAGAGTTAQAVSAPIGGLSPGTTYHYRLMATSAGGTVYSAEQTFTTRVPPPPAPVLRFKIRSGQTRKSVLRDGLKLTFTCDRACSVSFAASVAPSKAVDVAGVPIALATGAARLSRAGHGSATLKLTRAGRTKLKHARRLALVIHGAARNSAGVAGRPLTHALTLR